MSDRLEDSVGEEEPEQKQDQRLRPEAHEDRDPNPAVAEASGRDGLADEHQGLALRIPVEPVDVAALSTWGDRVG